MWVERQHAHPSGPRGRCTGPGTPAAVSAPSCASGQTLIPSSVARTRRRYHPFPCRLAHAFQQDVHTRSARVCRACGGGDMLLTECMWRDNFGSRNRGTFLQWEHRRDSTETAFGLALG